MRRRFDHQSITNLLDPTRTVSDHVQWEISKHKSKLPKEFMWETAKNLPFGDGYQHPKWWLGAHLVTSEDTATHGYPHGRRYKKSCHNNWSHQRIRNIVTTCFFSSSMGVKNMYNLQVGLLQLWIFHLKWRSQESKKKIQECGTRCYE